MPFITQGKTNLTYLLIVVVLAVIVGGGILGYYYSWIKELETKLIELESKLPTDKTDETVNWKIYQNKEYGFEVKYPNDISLEEYPSVNLVIFDDQISIYVSTESPEECLAECPTIQSKQDIKVGNLNGTKYAGLTYGTAGANTQHKYIEIAIPHGNSFFRFRAYPLEISKHYDIDSFQGDIPANTLELFNQILSTFKFLD